MSVGGPSGRAKPRRAAAVVGTAMLIALAAAAAGAPLFARHDPGAPSGAPVVAPDRTHWLGTNMLGQDLWSQLLYGARTSLLIGFMVAAVSTAISAVAGTAAGAGRRGGGLALGLIDLFIAIPAVPIVVLLVVFLGPGFWPQVVALALVGWAAFARIVRAQVAVTLRKDYVEAARALGATPARVLRRCVAPDVLPVLFTKFLLTVRWAILLEATLGLLGLGDAERVSWGTMLHQAFAYPLLFVTDTWLWWAAPPALAIVATSLGLMAIGQDLDLWLNPHTAPDR